MKNFISISRPLITGMTGCKKQTKLTEAEAVDVIKQLMMAGAIKILKR